MRITALILLSLATVSEASLLRGPKADRKLSGTGDDQGDGGCGNNNPFGIDCTLMAGDAGADRDEPCVDTDCSPCTDELCFAIPAYGVETCVTSSTCFATRCGTTKEMVAVSEGLSVDVVKIGCTDDVEIIIDD